MPELPEAERARALIAERALGRLIVAVDDRDTYVSRPHAPGELSAALLGRRLTSANRIGKTLWLETDGGGPDLGLHLGMAGRIAIDEEPHERWDRFSLTFEDGGRLALRDKRRLGRAVLAPDLSRLGPDAAVATRAEFRRRVGRSGAPIKARIMDQGVIAGIGNLLADEILWQARIDPRRPASSLSEPELDALRRAVRAAIRSAVRRGGAHTGALDPHREPDGHCPRCRAPLSRTRIGGRTTYWCPVEQV
ncbi:MAG: formamidopyrimidine-DNA glycosylase [Actinomycetota bacterium]|nr:formamidopyrimidine-DNA glycosylase [Actinomycetota bacterium]